MKNRLKILGIGLLLTIPAFSENSLPPDHVRYTDEYGIEHVAHKDSPEIRTHIDSVKRARGQATTNLNPFIDHRTNTTQAAGEGTVEYQSGVYELNDKYLEHKNTKGEAIQQIAGMGGQIAQQASTLTEDPKTAANAAAAGGYMSSAGSLMGSIHYASLSSDYANASRQNTATATANKTKLTAVETRLPGATAAAAAAEAAAASAPTDESLQVKAAKAKKEVTDLTTIQTDLTAQIGAQEGLASAYNTDSWIHTGFSSLNFLSAGALAWTADMQHQQGIQLAKTKKRCLGVRNDPTCPGFDPSTLIKPTTPPPGTPGPLPVPRGSGGFGGNPDDNTLGGANVSGLDNNQLLQPAGSGAGAEGSDSSFLKPSSGFGAAGSDGSAKDPSKEGDFAKGMSADVTYGGGGADLGLIGGSHFSSAPSGGLEGFDISQFLPAHLRGEDYTSFEIKAVNRDEAKKAGILLGKDSPSLFTRITKAHQKKAPEMSQEVL